MWRKVLVVRDILTSARFTFGAKNPYPTVVIRVYMKKIAPCNVQSHLCISGAVQIPPDSISAMMARSIGTGKE